MVEDYDARVDVALKRCEELRARHDGFATQSKWLFHALQIVGIIAGVLAPVLIFVWPDDKGMGPQSVKALTAAVGALSVALVNQFGWRRQWTRNSVAAIALASERVKFETRTRPYASKDPEEVLTSFVERVEAIRSRELSQFLEQQQQEEKAATPRKSGSKAS